MTSSGFHGKFPPGNSLFLSSLSLPRMAQILIIDDDPAIQRVLQKAILKEGYQVELASDGQRGIELARALQPSLIICDWVMPGVDGLEVCRQVKAHPNLSTTFFILLTSRSSLEYRVS